MGQRLVVDLIQNDEVVAAIYYHWSSYFTSTIYELSMLSKAILDAERNGKDKLLSILEMLEEPVEHITYLGAKEIRHGGVRGTQEELETAKKLFPNHEFETDVNRNEGIISFTKEGIQNFHDWEEGLASINLDTHEINNNVYLDPDPFELEAEYDTDEDGNKYIKYYTSGKVSINGRTCDVDAFDCTCESILKLFDFMDKEYEIYMLMKKEPEGGLQ